MLLDLSPFNRNNQEEYNLYERIAIAKGEDANLQDNDICFGGREKVGTKYGDIILSFWKDSKVQNLHFFCLDDQTTQKPNLGSFK